jgi:hypothetical protein
MYAGWDHWEEWLPGGEGAMTTQKKRGVRPGLAAGALGAVALAWLAAAAAGEPAGPPDAQPPAVNVEDLRKQYPLESMADRLAYEADAAKALAKLKVTDDALKRLESLEKAVEEKRAWDARARALMILHSENVHKFINRDGFGVGRMTTPGPGAKAAGSFSPGKLELRTAPAVTFLKAREAALRRAEAKLETEAKLREEQRAAASHGPKGRQLLWEFHQGSALDFLNPDGFGFVKDREHVAGFQPHHFREPPELPDAFTRGQTAAGKEPWVVGRVELVSLLKHSEPAVYVGDSLPRMQDAKDAATRPLSDFEEKALQALKDGEDISVWATEDRIRMLGSLRAATQCLDCHQVKRGDLLGAFSYTLDRKPRDEK